MSTCSNLEFVRELKNLCEMQVGNDLCRKFDFLDGNPLYEKILDTFKGMNNLDRMWYQRLKMPDSAFLIGKIFKNTQKRFNAAVILNGDDSPDSLKFHDESLPSLSNVYIEKISKDQGICDILKNALTWSGRLLDLVYIKGHGSMFGIRLSNTSELNTVNVADVGPCFKEALAEGAPIALGSCSTGRERYKSLNIAERLAGETGHPVDAPTQNSRSVECSFLLQQSQNDRMVTNPTEGLLFQCEKTKKFEDETNDDDKVFGKYTKRFIRKLSELDAEAVCFDMDFI